LVSWVLFARARWATAWRATARSNKELKLTKPGKLRSFAA
jgi:hypothetical protein